MTDMIVVGTRLSLMAGAVLAAAGSMTPFEAGHHVRHRNPATGRPRELTRKQTRAADRSKKQYLLKGIRP